MSDLADKVVLLWQVEGVAGRGAAQVHPGRGAAVVPGTNMVRAVMVITSRAWNEGYPKVHEG